MLKKAALDTATFFVALIANRAVGLLVLPVYSRLLSPEDYGVLQFYSTIGVALSMVTVLGLDSAIYILLMRLDEPTFRTLLRSCLLYLAIGPPLALGSILYLGEASFRLLFPDIPWHPFVELSLGVCFFSMPLSIAAIYARGRGDSRMFLLWTLATTLIPTGLSLICLASFREGALSVLQGQFAGTLILAMVAFAYLIRLCGTLSSPFFDPALLKAAFLLGAPYLPHLLCAWALNGSDRWILAQNVPLQELGLYGMAYAIGMAISALGQALVGTLAPIYARGLTDPETRAALPWLLKPYVLAATLGWLAIALFSREFFLFLTRPAYYAAALWSPWIALGYFALVAVNQPHQMVIEVRGRTWLILLCSAPAAAFNIAVNLVAIPLFGVWAAVGSTIGSLALQAVLTVFISHRLDRLPFPWLRLLPASGTCLIAYWFAAANLSVDSPWVSLLLKLLLFIAVGTALLFILGIDIGGNQWRRWRGPRWFGRVESRDRTRHSDNI